MSDRKMDKYDEKEARYMADRSAPSPVRERLSEEERQKVINAWMDCERVQDMQDLFVAIESLIEARVAAARLAAEAAENEACVSAVNDHSQLVERLREITKRLDKIVKGDKPLSLVIDPYERGVRMQAKFTLDELLRALGDDGK